jgi:hypothetical protein
MEKMNLDLIKTLNSVTKTKSQLVLLEWLIG